MRKRRVNHPKERAIVKNRMDALVCFVVLSLYIMLCFKLVSCMRKICYRFCLHRLAYSLIV